MPKIKSMLVQDKGVVALITTIVVGLLLVVITTSAIALMSNELRQASDFDNSTKAYFAAESGIEDALTVLRRGMTDGEDINQLVGNLKPGDIDGCEPYAAGSNSYAQGISPNLSGDDSIAYTCQILSTSDNRVEAQLLAEAATQVDLNGVDNPNRIRLSWNKQNTEDPQNSNLGEVPVGFPSGDNWDDNPSQAVVGNKFPAVMEVTIISYPNNQPSFSASQVHKDTVVLKPAASGSASANFNTPPNTQPVTVGCAQGGDYSCSIELTGLPGNRNFVISLHARYNSAYYKVEALGAGGTELEIPNAQLTIDVTGKAGSVFRRVQAKAPLGPQIEFPLFTLLADDNICKVMEVLQGASGYATTGGERGCDLFP